MAEKEKKVRNSENAVQRYFRETLGELRKVNWPTWPETKRLTGLVLLVMLVVGSIPTWPACGKRRVSRRFSRKN